MYKSIDKFFSENWFTSIILEKFSCCIFVIDLILNFFTAFYKRGVLNLDAKSIVKHYLRGKFAFDFITIGFFFLT